MVNPMHGERQRRHLSRGFTLIELMMVVALIGLLATLAAPSFLRAKRRADLHKESRALYSAFLQAQSLALDTGRVTELVLRRGGANRGWELRADRDADGTRELVASRLFANEAPSVDFGPLAGFPRDFAVPFDGVAHDRWCTESGGGTSCTIRVDPDGTFDATGSAALEDTSGDLPDAVEAVVFVGPTGALRLERTE